VKRLRAQDGQAAVLSVLFLLALLGIAALVVDTGSWFRASRAAQSAADASALAGAQALPDSPSTASALAQQYGVKNGGGVAGSDVRILSGIGTNDTIEVTVNRETPGFFSRVFGIEIVDIAGTAKARAGLPAEVRWTAPFVVDEKHEYLSGPGCPCWNVPTSLDLQKVGPGNFRIINLDNSKGGTGPPILADWIANGYDGDMPLGWYYGDPGAKFNSSQVEGALDARIGDELLFPVYRSTRGNGSNLQYQIVGWVGFLLTGWDAKGNNGQLYGSFQRVIWDGLQQESNSGGPDFGVRTVMLVG
jgi:hypothetical protein